ncbi:MAG: RNA polymerase sigma factor [Pseudohongiellaceae bacterium]
MAGRGGDDEALIEAAIRGSARAWDRLVRRYEQRVYNFALRLTGNTTDARDVMQEVFLGVYRSLHRFRGDAQFSSWLFRIAHNKAVDLQRRQRTVAISDTWPGSAGREESGAGEYDSISDDSRPGPLDQALSDEVSEQVLALLLTLPAEQRMVVELKLYQSLTFEAIAEMESISPNTAKTRFYTALRKLRHTLEQENER